MKSNVHLLVVQVGFAASLFISVLPFRGSLRDRTTTSVSRVTIHPSILQIMLARSKTRSTSVSRLL